MRTLSAAELKRGLQSLDRNRSWLDARGIAYLFVVAPDKHSIYREMLGPRFTQVSPATPWDQISETLAAQSQVEFVDLRPPLLEAKSLGPVYDKTDTHWNELGALVATRAIVDALRPRFPALRPPTLPERISWYSTPPRGLARLMAIEHMLEESSPRLDRSNAKGGDVGELTPLTKATAKTDPSVSAYPERLARLVHSVSGVNDPELPSALVVHDSFGELLQPLLAERFSRIVYVLRSVDRRAMAELIELERPDVVIEELAERWLVNLSWHPSFSDG